MDSETIATPTFPSLTVWTPYAAPHLTPFPQTFVKSGNPCVDSSDIPSSPIKNDRVCVFQLSLFTGDLFHVRAKLLPTSNHKLSAFLFLSAMRSHSLSSS